MKGIECIEEYRKNRNDFLPMIDHERHTFCDRNEFGDVNIGWNCGFIGSRPYFYEVWATDGMTLLTIFLSTEGIEDYDTMDIEKMLIDEAHIFEKKEGYSSPSVLKLFDGDGNEFFSINMVVGMEDEPAVIDGAPIYPFALLNDLNKKASE